MRKSLYILILFFIISCSRNNSKKDFTQNSVDSLTSYIAKVNDENISYEERIRYNNKSYKYLTHFENNKIKREGLSNVAELYYKFNKLDDLNKSSNLLLSLSNKANDTFFIGKAYNLLGRYNLERLVNDSAFYYFSQAEKIFYKYNDSISLSKNYMNKANVQLNENDFSGSEQSSFSALKFMLKSNDVKAKYNLYNFIGSTSDELGNYNNSLLYYQKALDLSKNPSLIKYKLTSSCQNNLGFVYQNLNEHKTAIEYFKAALRDKNLSENNPSLYSKLIDNYAYSKFKSNDYTELPDLFFKSLRIREENKLNSGIILNKIHLSEYYRLKNDTLRSKKYSYEALNLAKTTKVSSDILASLKQLSNVDTKNSAVYSKEYIKLSDSIQVAERKIKDQFARIQFETDEIIQEKDQLEEKNRNILNYFMGTILIGGVMFFLRSQRAKNRELILRQAQQKANEDIYKLIITQQNKLDEGRVLEKTRIAKELHDGVLGRLFGLRLNLDGLNDRKDEESVEMRLQYLSELKNIEQDLREISHELSREKFVLINNFVAIVSNLLDEQTKVNKANLKSFIGEDIDWDVLSNTTKINLYRILQESLQNINKYANAQNIKVDFKKDKKGNLILNIVDDGIGFDVDKKTRGIGIQNIISRTHESQGIIDIKSEKNKGTRITITVPLEGKTIKI